MKKEDYSEATQSVANSESKKWSKVVSTAVLAAAILTSSPNMAALADLNKFEAATRGEFGIGSAAQFGSADLRYVCLMRTLYLLKLFSFGK